MRIGICLLMLLMTVCAGATATNQSGFKWTVLIKEFPTNKPLQTLEFKQSIFREKLKTPEGECYFSVLPAKGKEQSANITCNGFTIGAACIEGDHKSGWISGIIEGKQKSIIVNATCDQFESH